jgi:hypothetical protein
VREGGASSLLFHVVFLCFVYLLPFMFLPPYPFSPFFFSFCLESISIKSLTLPFSRTLYMIELLTCYTFIFRNRLVSLFFSQLYVINTIYIQMRSYTQGHAGRYVRGRRGRARGAAGTREYFIRANSFYSRIRHQGFMCTAKEK